MKFCKIYQEFVQEQDKRLPGVGLKTLKKILKECNEHHFCNNQHDACLDHCTLCDDAFFHPLLNEMSTVVGCFNKSAQKLLHLHLASGFRKYISCFSKCSRCNHVDLIQEGKDLVAYALIHATALRKILKKYDKIHDSKQGQAFKSQVQKMHAEILKSPWLFELIAFQINLKNDKVKSREAHAVLGGCSLQFVDGKPSLSYELFDSVKVDVDLTCSICLDTVFDPVALACGHIFCYMCACSAGSVSIMDGLKEVDPNVKCPLCREAGVYDGAVHLDELKILLKRSCPEYWKERNHAEREERIRQAKEHWEFQYQAFMGI